MTALGPEEDCAYVRGRDRTRRAGQTLVILLSKFLVDFSPSFLEPFPCLRDRLFQIPLNFFSKILLLDLLCCLGKSSSYFIADFLGSAPDPFDHTAVVRWFTLSRR